ncbi:MAG: SPOR domain-containing protein [Brevundimonas sp.]|uniref:SPOR domain-containing protein n=1 Tax=Brevundimonas sp. TaxID=1871086 RepID=UPI004034089B
MTSSRTLRPVLTLLAGGLVASCGAAEVDANRFANLAQQVADIPVDGPVASAREPQETDTAATRGLRPAFGVETGQAGALRVEVLDPHALWDARDGLRRPPAAAEPVLQQAVQRAVAPAPVAVTPEVRPMAAASRGPRTTIQLGAYSSPEAARSAWAAASAGKARAALNGLTPDFVAVQVNGKPYVRLRVSAPAATAAAICRAAEVSDPWCLRGA